VYIQVLLSVYNGEKYLAAQIQSIVNQTHRHWELLIKNDQSTDGSLAIIEEFTQAYPNQIKLINTLVGGNATRSFMGFLPLVSAPYLMFCDQDDVWFPNKISISLQTLQQVEKENPIALVFSDMEVVDSDLNLLHASFLKQHQLNPNWRNNAYYVMAQSLAAGCTMMFTKKLVDTLNPIDDALFQHDHWLLIHAAYYGKIGFINQSTLKYRQHNSNSLGAHGISVNYFISKLKSLGLVTKRWLYLNRQLTPKPSLIKIGLAKLYLNLGRLTRFSKFAFL